MQPRSGDTSRSTARSLPSLQSQLRAVLASTASLNQLLKLSRAFKHSTHILATTPAPVRISCGVSFWQTLQKRSVRGKATGCDEYPGHESIVWPPMVDIMLLGCPLCSPSGTAAVLAPSPTPAGHSGARRCKIGTEGRHLLDSETGDQAYVGRARHVDTRQAARLHLPVAVDGPEQGPALMAACSIHD
jgi:hypothetical protein